MKNSLLYKVFITLILVLIALSVLLPVFWVVMASLKKKNEFYGNPWALPEGFYIGNFIDAWKEAGMGRYFMNSVVVTVVAIAILLAVALPAAYVLARFDFMGDGIFRILFKSGLFINISYIVVPIFLMLIDVGKYLDTSFLNSRFVLSLVYASTALPFTVYLLSGFMKSIPREFEEAAAVDGCGYFRTMVKIIFPLAKPSVITVLLFNSLSFWNEYIIALTLMPDEAKKTLPVGLMNLMKAQNAAADFGRMYAGLVIVMIPTLILYITVQKKLLTGMTAGGVKG